MIVFLLRHADRRPEPQDDLAPAGVERARLLARMVGESGVSVGFCSEAVRARRTLEPLKQRLGDELAITVVRTDGPGGTDAHVHEIVRAVKQLPADAVGIVVSHSNTVGPIIAGLGGGPIAPIGAGEFDKLFVLFIDLAGAATLLRLRYGAAT